ncbi:hypothetical protein ACQPX6_25565 [Actinomycetospora sp. CA-101289]|uniref:hypothetical protein n=1 Tax=Actinomycetospora sp. CA-101289 TaxID=3239893 RepID=UPI003D964BD0
MSVTTSWLAGPSRVRRPVRRPASVPAPTAPTGTWQRRLLDDLLLFLLVLALGMVVAVLTVLL